MQAKANKKLLIYPLLLLILYFFSGAAGLTYQVIWLRYLKLIFGVTHLSVSLIVSAFMTGLALGSYFIGKWADKNRSPLLLFGLSELAIGLYALLSPSLFSGVDSLYMSLGQSEFVNSGVSHAFRFLMTFIILILPTSLMGGTFPLISKAFIKSGESIKKDTALLYGLNTMGAMLGAFLAGFIFLRNFGTLQSLHIAAALNLSIGFLAIIVQITLGKNWQQEDTKEENKHDFILNTPLDRLIFIGFGISGFISLTYEVLWTRGLIFFLGLTTYAFTTILVTFLAGIALGSMALSLFSKRIKHFGRAFAWIEILIGISALIALPLLHKLHPLSASIMQQWQINSWAGILSVKFIIAFLVMLFPTFLMGMSMPVVISWFTKNRQGLGTNIGRIYSINTVGSIFGSLFAGFIFIPLFGIQTALTLMVWANILLGVAIFYVDSKDHKKNLPAYTLSVLGLIGGLIFLFNTESMIFSSVEFSGHQKRYKLLYAHEGPEASIAVLQDKINNERELNINGESTAFTIYQDMQVHKLLAHLPALIHPDPRDFLVVGFGFGSTSYGSSLYPNSNVDCVEILKDEIKTAPWFEKENHNVIAADNFNLIINDGRDYIKTTNKQYDIISFNAIHPKISPNLYTHEFYEMCRRILKPDGMIIAWLPPNAISEEEFTGMIRTFNMVYENSSLWYVNPSHMLLMGSNQEFSISYERLIERLSIPAVNADLAETNYDNVLEILTNFVAAGDELKKYSEKAPFNSDDFPVVEFSRVMSVAVNTDVTESLLRIKQPILPYLTNIPDSISSHLESDLGRYNQMKDYVIQGQVYAWTGKYDKAESYYQKALRLIPSANAEYLLDKVLNIGDELKALIKFNPRNEKVLKALGENYLKNKQLREAKNQLRRALEIKNDYHEARHLLGIVYFYENVIQTALNEFQTVISKRPDYGPSYFYAGLCYWKMGNLPGATNAFKTALDLDPGEGNNYLWYGKALEMAGKKNEALDIYYRLLDIEPANLEALQASDRLKKSMTFNR